MKRLYSICPHDGPEVLKTYLDISQMPGVSLGTAKCAKCDPEIECSICGEKGHVYCQEECGHND